MLAACFPVRWPVHVGQHGNLRNPQTVNDDMHMDIFGVAVPVRVGADKSLVSGEMLDVYKRQVYSLFSRICTTVLVAHLHS